MKFFKERFIFTDYRSLVLRKSKEVSRKERMETNRSVQKMSTEIKDPSINETETDVIQEEVNLNIKLYMFFFFIIFTGAFLIPGILFFFFILGYFTPIVLEAENILVAFTQFEPLIIIAITPLVFIGLYILHLFLMAVVTRWLWQYTERKSPSKSGIIPRNIASKVSDYYHVRSFMIKYPKNAFVKGPFPWLANWLFNFVGTNKIGKGTTIEEQLCGDKFVDIGENCYIGVNSVLTSHLVDGIFGNIVYFKIKIGDNVTFTGLGCVGPGTEVNDNSYLLPFAASAKHAILKGNNYYFGSPLRKIFKKKVAEYLDLSEEDFKKEKELANIQKKPQNKEENISND